MSDVDRLVGRCDRTWRRLRVASDERSAMAAELRDDLEQAAAGGVDPTVYLGGDPDGFARAWVSERGVVRPRFRVASTTLVATASMLPGAAFAAVLPLLSTSEWGITFLVRVFPGQRANTNLDCLYRASNGSGCGTASWDPPGGLIIAWLSAALAITFIGALAGSSAWLRRCADPLRPSTLRWMSVALPVTAISAGGALAFIDKSEVRPDVGNGAWAPILALCVVVAVLAVRTSVVVRARVPLHRGQVMSGR